MWKLALKGGFLYPEWPKKTWIILIFAQILTCYYVTYISRGNNGILLFFIGALTGKGVLVPLSRGASTASWLSKAFQSGFPKQLEKNLLLYRALILAQSVVSGGLVGPIKIHQIQGTRAFFWFTTEGRLSAKSMVRFQLIIYNNLWSLSTANSIASILLYSRSTQSSHSLVKWIISS